MTPPSRASRHLSSHNASLGTHGVLFSGRPELPASFRCRMPHLSVQWELSGDVCMLCVAHAEREWAQDCALYGTDVCTAFWEYLYLRRQALRFVARARARGLVVSMRQAWTWVWQTTLHTLGERCAS